MEKNWDVIRYEAAAAILPNRLRKLALALPEEQKAAAEEFRLRAGRPMTVLLPEETPRWLSEGCRGKDGARRLRRAVQDRVEAPLAAFLLQCPKKPVRIRGRIRDNALQFF